MLNLPNGKYLGVNKSILDAGGLILSETQYQSQVFQVWHSHENAHISFAISGGNREQRTNADIDVRPGKLLFYHGDERHRNRNTALPSKNINLEITQSFMDSHQLKEHFFHNLVQKNIDLPFILLKMLHEAKADKDSSASSIHMLMQQLIHVRPDRAPRDYESKWVNIVREYLDLNWHLQPDLMVLANVASVHPVTISKYFPHYFGDTLGAYLPKLKIKHALSLIKTGKISLTEVAYTCGFSDQSHFSRTFRELTLMRPKSFQRL